MRLKDHAKKPWLGSYQQRGRYGGVSVDHLYRCTERIRCNCKCRRPHPGRTPRCPVGVISGVDPPARWSHLWFERPALTVQTLDRVVRLNGDTRRLALFDLYACQLLLDGGHPDELQRLITDAENRESSTSQLVYVACSGGCRCPHRLNHGRCEAELVPLFPKTLRSVQVTLAAGSPSRSKRAAVDGDCMPQPFP